MNYSNSLKDPIFKIVQEASSCLNLKTYVVGGWVRDLIMNRQSEITDIDFICIGSGTTLAEEVNKKLKSNKSKIKIYKNFGTAMINYGQNSYEFIGARKESYRKNSRKPIVENGTFLDDQQRRDFTINALYISLNKDSYGELIDPFNGLEDIQNKIIKTPQDPNLTYIDDPLRMMRAIRFASQLNFKIEHETYNAIIKNSERLEIVSQERITDELNKIISSNTPSKGFDLLLKTNLLSQFFYDFTLLKGVESVGNHSHKDNFYHTLEVLDNISKSSNNLWLRWAALLHDIAKPKTKKYDKVNGWTFHSHEYVGSKMVPKIFRQLKLPLNDKMRYVQKLVLLHLRPIVLSQEKVTDSAIRRLLFDAGDDIEDLMKLCEADITSKNQKKVIKFLDNFKKVREKLKEVEEKDNIRNFQPPIDGIEIMKLFNLKAGKNIGILKNSIKNAILDGKINNNKKEALEFVKKKARDLKINLK
tara:strand:+ start:3340 stop:4761 length:1422 start_codon:yes stop_codon:yes gene_type:complete